LRDVLIIESILLNLVAKKVLQQIPLKSRHHFESVASRDRANLLAENEPSSGVIWREARCFWRIRPGLFPYTKAGSIHRNDIVSKKASTAPTAFKRSPSLKTTLAYMGSNMSLLAKGTETGGRLALMEFHSRPGNEPPPHIHEWEHELYYLLEGRMEFYCDGEILSIGAGEVAFLPQGKAHAFYVRSPIVRALIAVQATDERSVGLDRYFIDMGEPAASMELPHHQATHIMSGPARAIRVAATNGIRILSPKRSRPAI
jgi:mannose-6-phosphate isomerase-like protein (cupin superfamily)